VEELKDKSTPLLIPDHIDNKSGKKRSTKKNKKSNEDLQVINLQGIGPNTFGQRLNTLMTVRNAKVISLALNNVFFPWMER
jgi:hypothetical protein